MHAYTHTNVYIDLVLQKQAAWWSIKQKDLAFPKWAHLRIYSFSANPMGLCGVTVHVGKILYVRIKSVVKNIGVLSLMQIGVWMMYKVFIMLVPLISHVDYLDHDLELLVTGLKNNNDPLTFDQQCNIATGQRHLSSVCA